MFLGIFPALRRIQIRLPKKSVIKIAQKKEQKRLQAMLNSMEVGDSIVTTGGFYGVIIDMTEEDVIVEFGNNKNCRIPMRKQAIAEVEKAEQASA